MLVRKRAVILAAFIVAGTLTPVSAEATQTPAAITMPAVQKNVHPGAFCAPRGATGYTSKGTKMKCTKKRGDDRARWRAA